MFDRSHLYKGVAPNITKKNRPQLMDGNFTHTIFSEEFIIILNPQRKVRNIIFYG